MDIDSYDNGVPSWVDVQCPDTAKAAAFYSGLFGWDVQFGPPEAGGYAIAQLRGRSVAGIGPQPVPGPAVWAGYVNVDSADDIAAKVQANGGSLMMPPFDVMDVGRMCFFSDPYGAVIGLWQPKAHKGAGIVNEPNSFSWNELITDNVAGSKTFYAAVFGWTAETYGDGPGAYTEFKLGDRSVAGMMQRPAEMPADTPPFWSVYFSVADLDPALARVAELGGTQITPVMDIEPGRFAVVADDQGAVFNLIQLKVMVSA
jgi:predicted enzyme related to lactoylglutathione lyase